MIISVSYDEGGRGSPEPTSQGPAAEVAVPPSPVVARRDVLHRPGGVEAASRSVRRGFTPAPSVASSEISDDDMDDILSDIGLPVTVEFHDDNDGTITVVQVHEGTKITEAATKAGVYIPTVC